MSITSNPLSTVPNELWRQIFRFATTSTKSLQLYDADFYPLKELWSNNQRPDDTLGTKKVIILVCQSWRSLGIEFLYEHVQVETLAKIFESMDDRERKNIGRYVRRLQFPSRPFQYTTCIPLLNILAICPRLTVLVQPTWEGGLDTNAVFWENITRPSSHNNLVALLSGVKRIDWCTYGNEDHYQNHCTVLSAILLATTNLSYLHLRYKIDPFPGSSIITLPSLETLLLEGEIGNFGLNTPKVTYMVVDHIDVVSDNCVLQRILGLRALQIYGFGGGYRFDVFRLSPQLTEFCCSVNRETTIAMGCLHPGVRTIRLRCMTDPDRRAVEGFRKKSVMLYNTTTFPALELVVLYGEGWSTFAQHSEFKLFRLRILDRGCRIEDANGNIL